MNYDNNLDTDFYTDRSEEQDTSINLNHPEIQSYIQQQVQQQVQPAIEESWKQNINKLFTPAQQQQEPQVANTAYVDEKLQAIEQANMQSQMHNEVNQAFSAFNNGRYPNFNVLASELDSYYATFENKYSNSHNPQKVQEIYNSVYAPLEHYQKTRNLEALQHAMKNAVEIVQEIRQSNMSSSQSFGSPLGNTGNYQGSSMGIDPALQVNLSEAEFERLANNGQLQIHPEAKKAYELLTQNKQPIFRK